MKFAVFYQTYTYVFEYKSRTVDFSMQHIIYQIEEEELLFAMILEFKRSEKNASTPPRALRNIV